ncbi:MAG: hypothetical protein ABSG41_20335 [Bryobacteraceae bacterium]|jgi:hypothetical protein
MTRPTTLLKSLTAAFYVTAYRIFHLLHSGSQALFEGFWLGLLPDSVTDLVSEWSYGEGKEYTGAAYLDSGLQFCEEIAIDRFFTPGCSMLVAAAGGGRELIALARRGYRAKASTAAAPWLPRANERSPTGESRRGSNGRSPAKSRRTWGPGTLQLSDGMATRTSRRAGAGLNS